MKSDKLKIDPEEFAKLVMQSESCLRDTPEATAKANLTLFLTAKVLAERFNDIEEEAFKPDVLADYDMTIARLQTMALSSFSSHK
ncbi:hypothetical protein ACVQ8P_05280 [Dellaglioa sp. BT-FLS60]